MFLEQHRVSMHRHYYRICLEQQGLYLEADGTMASLDTANFGEDDHLSYWDRQQEAYERRERAAAIGIAFAGMCLEAFFFDYAASNLGQSSAKDLDKLDLPSKLLVVPKLVCNTGIDRSSDVYEKVKRLAADRNFLVHFKSKGFELDDLDKASEYHDKLNDRFRGALTNGIQAIRSVMAALDHTHGKPGYYSKQFDVVEPGVPSG